MRSPSLRSAPAAFSRSSAVMPPPGMRWRTSATTAGPMKVSSGSSWICLPPLTKCSGASTWLPACSRMWTPRTICPAPPAASKSLMTSTSNCMSRLKPAGVRIWKFLASSSRLMSTIFGLGIFRIFLFLHAILRRLGRAQRDPTPRVPGVVGSRKSSTQPTVGRLLAMTAPSTRPFRLLPWREPLLDPPDAFREKEAEQGQHDDDDEQLVGLERVAVRDDRPAEPGDGGEQFRHHHADHGAAHGEADAGRDERQRGGNDDLGKNLRLVRALRERDLDQAAAHVAHA